MFVLEYDCHLFEAIFHFEEGYLGFDGIGNNSVDGIGNNSVDGIGNNSVDGIGNNSVGWVGDYLWFDVLKWHSLVINTSYSF